MGCGKRERKCSLSDGVDLGFGLGRQPHHSQLSLLPKVSTSHAHLLLEAIATNLGSRPPVRSSTAWVLLARLDFQTSEDRPRLFLNVTLRTRDDNHGRRFPRPVLHCPLFASHLVAPRPPLSSNSSYRLQLILCSWQTALCLQMGCLQWSNKLSLVFSFLSSCSTGQRALHEISPAPAPPLQARCALPIPDPVSRFRQPQRVLPTARTVAVISNDSTEARLSSCSPSAHYYCAWWEAIWGLRLTVPPGRQPTSPAKPWPLLGCFGQHDTRVEHALICCIVSPCRWIRWADGLVCDHISVHSPGLVSPSSSCMSTGSIHSTINTLAGGCPVPAALEPGALTRSPSARLSRQPGCPVSSTLSEALSDA